MLAKSCYGLLTVIKLSWQDCFITKVTFDGYQKHCVLNYGYWCLSPIPMYVYCFCTKFYSSFICSLLNLKNAMFSYKHVQLTTQRSIAEN